MKKLTTALLCASKTFRALTFGGATTDRVDCGSAAILDDMTQVTVMAWVYVTTLTDNRTLVSKYRGTSNEGWILSTSGATGNVSWTWERATTDQFYATNSTPLATTNAWRFIAISVNQTGPAINVYSSAVGAALTTATFGTTTAGSGAYNSDAARSLFLGNRDTATPALPIQGRIAIVGVVNRALSSQEVEAWRHAPRSMSGMVGLWILNGATSTQADLSGNGNNGTVTGTSQSDHVPLGPYFGFIPFIDYSLRKLGIYA